MGSVSHLPPLPQCSSGTHPCLDPFLGFPSNLRRKSFSGILTPEAGVTMGIGRTFLASTSPALPCGHPLLFFSPSLC